MFSRMTCVLIVALGGFVMAAGTVHAEAISIANPGFEEGTDSAIDGWTCIGATRWGGAAGDILPRNGSWMGKLNAEYHPPATQMIMQILKVGDDNLHMEVDDQITIDFYHGFRLSQEGRIEGALTMYLWADTAQGTLLASQLYSDPAVGGSWGARSFTYTATAGAVGRDLYFGLKNDSLGSGNKRQVLVDDFSGVYAPIPEPGTLALLATGLIGLLCYAWRRRK